MIRMTRKEAFSILKVKEGASREEIKQNYAKLALTTHPDQKSSSPETTKIFRNISLAYKRLQQRHDNDLVELSDIMEQFSTVFRFRMKTETGYVYFMYNPFTGAPDSDSSDSFDDDDWGRKHSSRKLKSGLKAHTPKKIIDVDPEKYKEMKANAEKNAEELLNEEDKAKSKARKRREKRLRQKEKKEKKKQMKEEPIINSTSMRKLQRGPDGDHRNSQQSFVSINNQASIMKSKYLSEKEGKSSISANAKTNGYLSEGSDSDKPNWDPGCAFVSNTIKNVKEVDLLKPSQKKVKTNMDKKPYTQTSCDTQQNKARDIIALSRQLAMQGNQLAGTQNYEEAAKLFTKAINLFNTDCRYFGNRSYCYDRMKKYEMALQDALTAIRLSSFWAKGYFRKGRALAGLGRYVEAENAFEEVLKLDKQCFDAEQELHEVRIKHLTEMGFPKKHCELALKKTGSLSLALDDLLSGAYSDIKIKDVIGSDSDDCFEKKFERVERASSSPPSHSSNDDAFSEVDYNSLWIGNITTRVTEEALMEYFKQFGHVTGVTAMYERRCAFANFATTESAKAALIARDTVNICGEVLVIRYPDRAFNQSATRINYKSRRECLYWRSTGCHFGSACRYLHVEANKGIDMQTVERTPYQSIVKY